MDETVRRFMDQRVAKIAPVVPEEAGELDLAVSKHVA